MAHARQPGRGAPHRSWEAGGGLPAFAPLALHRLTHACRALSWRRDETVLRRDAFGETCGCIADVVGESVAGPDGCSCCCGSLADTHMIADSACYVVRRA